MNMFEMWGECKKALHPNLLWLNLSWRCLPFREATGRLVETQRRSSAPPPFAPWTARSRASSSSSFFVGPPPLFLSSCRPFPPAQLLSLLITRMSKSLLSDRHNRLCCTLLSPYHCFFFLVRTVKSLCMLTNRRDKIVFHFAHVTLVSLI